MREKFEKIPPPLQKQIIMRCGAALVSLLLSFSYAPQNRCNTSSTFQKEKNHFVHITPRKSQFFHFIKKYIPLRFIDIKYFCNN